MKILVVDDEKLLVKGIKFNLEHEGYQVEGVYDGSAAVELARSGEYDLIILDVMMPQIDGLEACMRIREFSDVPIIMLTAKGEDTDKLMGFDCGADDYMTKPFNILELKARVKALLKRASGSGTGKKRRNYCGCTDAGSAGARGAPGRNAGGTDGQGIRSAGTFDEAPPPGLQP